MIGVCFSCAKPIEAKCESVCSEACREAYRQALEDLREAVRHPATLRGIDKMRKTVDALPVVKGAGRYRFVRDDDCHDYLIPADKKEQFDKWLEHQIRLWKPGLSDEEFKRREAEYTGEDFNDYRASRSPQNYTFTDPKAA